MVVELLFESTGSLGATSVFISRRMDKSRIKEKE